MSPSDLVRVRVRVRLRLRLRLRVRVRVKVRVRANANPNPNLAAGLQLVLAEGLPQELPAAYVVVGLVIAQLVERPGWG